MNFRHQSRAIALQILYLWDLKVQGEPKEAQKSALSVRDLQQHFEHFQVATDLQEFAQHLVLGTLRMFEALDLRLGPHTRNWRVSRLSSIDRSILRLAAFEMLDAPVLPPAIIISEAIGLAKEFGTAETPAFINGILDSLSAQLKNDPI